jgi:hypothetical protein
MQITQHTDKYGFVGYTSKRDKWHEWFRLEVSEGEAWRFYFPIERNLMRNTYTCWIWYLVPFVLTIRMVQVAVRSLYLDSRDMLHS